jgi:hypothetical protein
MFFNVLFLESNLFLSLFIFKDGTIEKASKKMRDLIWRKGNIFSFLQEIHQFPFYIRDDFHLIQIFSFLSIYAPMNINSCYGFHERYSS